VTSLHLIGLTQWPVSAATTSSCDTVSSSNSRCRASSSRANS